MNGLVYSLNWRNKVRFFSSCGSRSNRLSWYARSVSPKPFCLKRIMLRSDMEVAVFEQVIPMRMEGFPDRSRASCSSAEHLPSVSSEMLFACYFHASKQSPRCGDQLAI